MADKMLIDASHEEETRVVVVRGNRIEEFDFESQHKKQIRGNIYLAKVTRVEPSLQAAFVDYGGNRHGFLAFAEIHPDYYQIPLADRQALLRAEAEEHRRDEDVEHVETAPMVDLSKQDQPDVGIAPEAAAVTEETAAVEAAASPEAAEEAPAKKARPRRSRKKAAEPVAETTATEDAVPTDVEAEGASSVDNEDDGSTGGAMAAMVETDSISEDVDTSKRRHDDDDDDDDHGEEEVIESVGAEDAMEEVPDRVQRKPRKQYRIQEVIKRRQILLVQVAKEERGNKGAALTTYLSLAGRYSVLMPNTARGGGISRKITNPADRKRLKEIARLLEVPQGMGVILRTAGANRTKVEVKRDFEYLMRLWENVRTLTLASTAPCLVYEEGSLIKRSIRDLYNKDISEVIVSGEEGYREAKDFMKMLMPSHAKVVQPYRDIHPIFSRSGIEAQLDRMLQPQVTLKSGGYLIMNQTEALVSIDVNSGRSTREHSIEDTALQTNLEAADEVARQLRLRDLAGLIVIDFIDMEEKRNNRAVEKKLKECLKNDRARIQVGRISHFGLLEMSRQRIRASVLESTTQVCSHCGGSGHVRSQSSVALHVLRGIEEYLLKNTTHNITVRTTPDIALYLLNHKRQTIIDYESRFGVAIIIDADGSVGAQHFAIDRGEPVENPVKIETLFNFAAIPEDDDDDIVIEVDEEEDEELEEKPAVSERPVAARAESEADGNRKRKRRRRRRGRNGNAEQPLSATGEAGDEDEDGDDEGGEGDENTEATPETRAESEESQRRKRRRRGKRGGRRNRAEDGSELTAGEAGEDNGGDEDEGDDVSNDGAPSEAVAVEAIAEQADEGQAAMAAVESAPVITEEVKPARARGRRKPAAAPVEEPVAETAPAVEAEPELVEASADLETSVQEEAKPVRANRESNISSSEPTVKSTRVENVEGDDGKPKKAGWWQRRGFF
ncbi:MULTISPECIES: Rne/Rng family ribonuclease [Rhizobium]|uniref:Ribonuclease E n=1 Tax=Rhizobium leguminosarum bv. trifolii (strain WSM1325) TaxID=395491 RepID=C6AUW0_RHILS|nr:ribonuclease E/G [Rhizobium leguminosarum]ACS55685.1 ribonuclease, Rne/Rng family [Rhizobium leguminosarum bv. trifolii WSM1325]MBY2909110.1 Rne/Rng family ribonuclease [Rhizobium leguminosarum]MBY2913745.1 Rne/Rng family ribonuclease [Rhizobium leguminosarum]MBY2931791.1 Rne/Rng family ribonuclease [Rhizobium leguminosarum]MBY2938817.1 Rne/Rng family ribonuclease [Rhizobium leguminosarum]